METAAIQVGKTEQGPFVNLDALVLPAASAFTNQAYTPIPPQSRRMSIIASYAKAAAAVSGQAAFTLQWKFPGGVTDVYESVIDGTSSSVAAPFLVNPEYGWQLNGPVISTSLTFRVLSVEVPVRALAARVLVAEVGDAAHPGTVSVMLYTSSLF